jgi:major membrane immunogen (membrane-anchored lipoprotein)
MFNNETVLTHTGRILLYKERIMRKMLVSVMLVVLTVCFITGCEAQGLYRDGVYRAETPPDHEGYFCRVVLTVEQGSITACLWEIRDANRNNRLFDETYGPEVYKNQALYRRQSEENLRGMAGYAKALVNTQALSRVDAVTGATWAHRKFGEVLAAVLKKAKK